MDRRKILLVVAVLVAALGAGLVFAYAQGAEDRAADKQRTVPVLVATQDILPGESAAAAADAGKLLSEQVPESQVLAGSTNNGRDFADAIALTTIYAGEQLLTQKFGTIDDIEGTPTLPLPEGKTAITLQLTDAGRVGSFTQPGSHVAVYFTPVIPESAQPDTPDNAAVIVPACVIEDDLLVLGVGSQTVSSTPVADGATAPSDTVPVTLLTVAVDSEQASTLIGFQTAGDGGDGTGQKVTLTFALRNDSSDVRNTKVCAAYIKSFQQQLELAAPGRNANG
ncbi:Flp pilus assembly protein CpaB [Nocardioides rubriscoriae]|uniref:Flp pilus assembly protein CpaB n=1 Tax=Nocardioides rubriscoriae TaxID=642762 RepID=UPI0011DF0C99|nr:RcpC/CpaB family pilus assembly protein [Nocardioides rubriscoriae]